ncbi:aldehyde dehydrogenase [Phlyctema vagabunda]|uniref:aldehyde dehydrogenase (NAD(+)) n=1 Tax=Phlyctema vagabunda TaxID=108571 RepID=A0ABR4PTA9_9HELO
MSSVVFDLNRYPIPNKAFIDGAWTESKANNLHSIVSAVNDEVVCKDVQWADERDVDVAVESSIKGYQAWQAMSKRERRDALLRYAQLIKDRAEEIYWLEAVLIGKAKSFSTFEVDTGAEAFVYFAGLINSFSSDTVSYGEDHIQYTNHYPYGVCAAIVPFNGPIVCYCIKAASALAAGNSLIVKASEWNPFSTLFIVSLATEAGIPPGVINCITGDGVAGNALAAHMKIRKISFTGSLPVARQVQVAAAQSNLKSVTLELGGKSPVIVYPDANLDKATEFCCHFLMLNGQGCMLATRVYIHESIFDEMMPKIEARVQAYEDNLGSNPLDESTWSSPMFHRRQLERVLEFIEEGKKDAKLVRGGEIVEGKGCYIRPTIFTDPSPNAKVLTEEIFGPVVVVGKFKDDEEVIKLTNDTEFGLAAYIWTRDIGRALRISNRIEAGVIGINGLPWSPNTTFGGWKQSGTGVENGTLGMLDWTQNKSIKIQVE